MVPRILRGQVYQMPGGIREMVLACVVDDELLDAPFVILRPEDGGRDHNMTMAEFVEQNPELIH